MAKKREITRDSIMKTKYFQVLPYILKNIFFSLTFEPILEYERIGEKY